MFTPGSETHVQAITFTEKYVNAQIQGFGIGTDV